MDTSAHAASSPGGGAGAAGQSILRRGGAEKLSSENMFDLIEQLSDGSGRC
jgi:hypothetical protein